jgi:hypothetical protein
MEPWVKLFESLGTATAVLAVGTAGLWVGLRWCAREIVIPLRDRVISGLVEFFAKLTVTMDKVTESVDKMSEAQDRMAEVQHSQARMLDGHAKALERIEQNTQKCEHLRLNAPRRKETPP